MKSGVHVAPESVFTFAGIRNGKLYAIDKECVDMTAHDRHRIRQEKARPLWEEFLSWAEAKYTKGVTHAKTMDTLQYLLKHRDGLMGYLKDGRLPISNIKSEHVAKAIALARKTFLFSDTPSGASASARVFGVLETEKANGHNPYRYLAVLFSRLPSCQTLEDIEALLPWAITPSTIDEWFAEFPTPN